MTNPMTPHTEPAPAADGRRLERPCPYCAYALTYINTDTNMDGTRTAEYWCDNCCEYIYFAVPPAPAASSEEA